MERFKTVILIVFIGLSLFLTYQLWYAQKPTELTVEDTYEQIVTETPRPLEDVIVPSQVVAEIDGACFVFYKGEPEYESLWHELNLRLQGIHDAALQDAEPLDEEAQNSLTFRFKPPLPVGDEMPWLPGTTYFRVEKIKFYSLEDSQWLVLEKAGDDVRKSLTLPEEKAGLFSELISNISAQEAVEHIKLDVETAGEVLERELDIRNHIFVPKEQVFLSELLLKPEELDREKLIKTFFVDYNLARVIEERNGGLIYTDGEKGLRLTSEGLEYSNPQLEDGETTMNYPEALLNCSNLISYHGGWPQDLRLEEVTLFGRDEAPYYTFKLQMYYQGRPLYTEKPTKGLFNDHGLINFSRALFFVGGYVEEDEEVKTVEAAEWSEALKAAIRHYENQMMPDMRVKIRLEAMELGYAVIDTATFTRGQPVWYFQINGTDVFLSADELDLLDEGDIL